MSDAADDELNDLVTVADTRLRELAQSGAMRSDPYRLAVGVLVSVMRVLVAVGRRTRVGEMSDEDCDAVRAAMLRGVNQEGRAIGRQMRRRTTMVAGVMVTCAFSAGVVMTALVVWLNAGAEAVVLPGGAMLCQATGAKVDADGRHYYPALRAKLEVSP